MRPDLPESDGRAAVVFRSSLRSLAPDGLSTIAIVLPNSFSQTRPSAREESHGAAFRSSPGALRSRE